MNEVVHHGNYEYTGKHQNRPVHAVGGHRRTNRKADEDHRKADVRESEEVDRQTKSSQGPATLREGFASQAFQRDTADGHGIGRHEGEKLERDNGVTENFD